MAINITRLEALRAKCHELNRRRNQTERSDPMHARISRVLESLAMKLGDRLAEQLWDEANALRVARGQRPNPAPTDRRRKWGVAA